MLEYRLEVRLPSGKWAKVGGTRVYKDWHIVFVKYTQLAISRPNEKFRIACRIVGAWDEWYM